MSPKERSLAYQSYPGPANFSYNPLTGNLANSLHEKQNISAAKRVTLLDRPHTFFP